MKNYNQQANNFARKHGVELTILNEEYKKHFVDDEFPRWVFKCRLTRNGKSYTFDFGQSIAAGGVEPTMYDILSCLQKYDCGSFSDFCGEFGYEEFIETQSGNIVKNKVAERIYKAVCREYAWVKRLFGDVMEELQEIN